MATPRSVFLSHSPSIPRLYLSPPTPHIHRRPHVTTHRSRSEVSSSSTFTTLPPCTPSTRRALLFYYSTRPRRVRLVASAYIPGDLSSPSLSLSLFISFSSSLSSCLSSPPRPPLASRLTEKLESRRRIRGSSAAAAAAAVARCAPYLFFSSAFATFSSKLIYN